MSKPDHFALWTHPLNTKITTDRSATSTKRFVNKTKEVTENARFWLDSAFFDWLAHSTPNQNETRLQKEPIKTRIFQILERLFRKPPVKMFCNHYSHNVSFGVSLQKNLSILRKEISSWTFESDSRSEPKHFGEIIESIHVYHLGSRTECPGGEI